MSVGGRIGSAMAESSITGENVSPCIEQEMDITMNPLA